MSQKIYRFFDEINFEMNFFTKITPFEEQKDGKYDSLLLKTQFFSAFFLFFFFLVMMLNASIWQQQIERYFLPYNI